jgi:hypothetical protein
LLVAKTRELLRRGVRTDATIVDFEKDNNSESDYPTPIVEFVDLLGATHRVGLKLSYGKGWRRGDTKTIIYDTDNPNRLTGTTFAEVWLLPSAFVFMGGLGVLFGICVLFGIVPTE